MTNLKELNTILEELRVKTLERKNLGKKPLEFDIRLINVEGLLSDFAIENDIEVALPEFMTSDELFMIELLLGA